MPFLGSVREALFRVLESRRPELVVSVYPAYPYLFEAIWGGARLPFDVCTVITDSITINSVWYRCGSDLYIVANEPSRRVLMESGVEEARIRVLGFPVPPVFWHGRVDRPMPDVTVPRVLYMVNAGRELAPEIVRRILDLGGVYLTVTVGRSLSTTVRTATPAAPSTV